MAKRAFNNGHTMGLFAGCLDQIGLLEMKSLPGCTNGVIVLSDSFATSIFKQSDLRVFNKAVDGHLEMGFNATFDAQTLKNLRVSGRVGHGISVGKKSASARSKSASGRRARSRARPARWRPPRSTGPRAG